MNEPVIVDFTKGFDEAGLSKLYDSLGISKAEREKAIMASRIIDEIERITTKKEEQNL